MLWLFGFIVVMVGVLFTRNGRYEMRRYVEKRSLVWLSVHFVFLFFLGYLLLYSSKRVLLIVQDIEQLEQLHQI